MPSEEVELLRELVRLTRILVRPVAREILQRDFFDGETPRTEKIRVYAALDGSGVRSVASATGVSKSTVHSWSVDWKSCGLVDDEGAATFNFFDHFPELKAQVNGHKSREQ